MDNLSRDEENGTGPILCNCSEIASFNMEIVPSPSSVFNIGPVPFSDSSPSPIQVIRIQLLNQPSGGYSHTQTLFPERLSPWGHSV